MTLTAPAKTSLPARLKRMATVLATTYVLVASTDLPSAQAQEASEPAATTATYGNWVLRCVRPQAPAPASGKTAKPQSKTEPPKAESAEAKPLCEIVQTIQVQGNAQPIAQIAIGPMPANPALVMTSVLPVNVSIPGKVHVSSDGKTESGEKSGIDLMLVRCAPVGCFATAAPDVAYLAKLGTGDTKQGQLKFMDATGRTISIPISWQGLPQALQALSRQ